MDAHPARIGVSEPIPGVVYPEPSRLARYVEDEVLGTQSLAEAMRESFARNASRLALAGPQGDVTYAQLDEITDRLAVSLLRLGARPLDRVMFQIANCNEAIYAILACIKAQLIPVCTLAAHREQEIGYLARHSSARLHIISGADPKFDGLAFARDMQKQAPSLRHIVQAQGEGKPGAPSLADLVNSISAAEARREIDRLRYDPFQVVFFQLSGGTTGVPKIIPHFHNASLLTMQATADWYGYGAGDRIFNPLPMLHNLNMSCFYGPALLRGATFIVVPNVMPDTLVSAFKTYRPTWTFLSPPIVTRIEGAVRDGTIDFRDARGIIAPNNAPGLRAMFGAPVYHQYGMTEGTLTGTHEGDPVDAIDYTVGRAFVPSNRVRIMRPGTEEEIDGEEMGESVVDGPYTCPGYFDADDRNREAFTSDGAYRTGDLVRRRFVEGVANFVFCGRIKDVVDRGGEKISSEEVEWACNAHPSIAATAVIGMPDPAYGERVCAFVIARDNQTGPSVAELGEFLKTHGLAKFKWPERVEVVSEFPVTKSGKLMKAELRRIIREKLVDESREFDSNDARPRTTSSTELKRAQA
jgi:non-ribosomal peptide synthetase component E (peptide arylation enzyme)